MNTIIRKKGQEHDLSNEEGCQIVETALALRQPHLIASKRCLDKKESIASDNSFKQTAFQLTEIHLLDQVKTIWLEVLDVKEISMESDFFMMGGDSLTAIQLTYKLKTVLNVNVLPDDLLKYSQLKTFFEYINQKNSP